MKDGRRQARASNDALRIGWAQIDVTPQEPVLVVGQFHARVSEGVMDPITATALAIESNGQQVVFVSADLVSVPPELADAVRAHLQSDVDPEAIVMSGTHTHTGPDVRVPLARGGDTSCGVGVELPVMPIEDCIAWVAERIARAVDEAWQRRALGKVAYGLGHAVVGRNRRWVDAEGVSTMYGNTDTPAFRHIEGYEDHSVNVLAGYDAAGALTGLVVNVPCPSQVDENLFVLSADYWHETRQELRRRLGEGIFVLGQCSAAGDQSPHPLYEKRARERMWELAGKTQREVIAERIADGVAGVLELIGSTAAGDLPLCRVTERLEVPVTGLTQQQADAAQAEAEEWDKRYEDERAKLEKDPALKDEPRWYVPVTRAFRRANWFRSVVARFEQQAEAPTQTLDLHFVRLGDVAFATNPFEYYLDHGVHIKCRSHATQTFLVQLAGRGTYVPSERSTRGGGYGSVPASNPCGSDVGRLIADKSVEIINGLFEHE